MSGGKNNSTFRNKIHRHNEGIQHNYGPAAAIARAARFIRGRAGCGTYHSRLRRRHRVTALSLFALGLLVTLRAVINHAQTSDLLICSPEGDRIPYRTVYSRTVYAPIRRQRWAGQPPSHQSLVAAIKDGRRHRIPRSPTPAINAIKCPAARAQLTRSGLKN
ncbi:hypothetical protein DFH09DRAFT_1446394 [Mycena vulgaris]|nr:hypothetical protein DFH09DRAFT_1446394 [Mycena vulgaris]